MIHEVDFTAGDVTLRLAMGPKNGPPLVLLHGVTRRWQDFGTIIPTLAARWQIIGVDHRGHGGSSRASRYLVEDYINDALNVLASLDQPPILLGHSLGALTALGVAAAAPNAVRSIILADPPSTGFLANIEKTSYHPLFRNIRELAGQKQSTASIARTLGDIELQDGTRLKQHRDPVALRSLARCLLDLDPNVLTPLFEKHWLNDFAPLAAAPKVTCPALLLVGNPSLGGMLPDADATALHIAFADGARIDFPTLGHHLHAARPDLVLQTVIPFLDSL